MSTFWMPQALQALLEYCFTFTHESLPSHSGLAPLSYALHIIRYLNSFPGPSRLVLQLRGPPLNLSFCLGEPPGGNFAREQLIKLRERSALGLWHEEPHEDVNERAGTDPKEH